MAKTTATVTVGADTGPFERKMRTLGKGLAGGATMGAQRLGGMGMSALGTGLGIGAAFLGLQGLSGVFNKMLQVSPALNAAMTQLSVSVGNALLPAATKLAEVLTTNLPAIESALDSFGTMLADVIQFWTEDALNPAVWSDIGTAIAESLADSIKYLINGGATQDIGGAVAGLTGSEAAGGATQGIVDALIDANPAVWLYKYNAAVIEFFTGAGEQGAKSL